MSRYITRELYFSKALAPDRVDAEKKRPAFPAERFCLAQRMR
jgi:hypothetical protein